jgi:hypothetical protein
MLENSSQPFVIDGKPCCEKAVQHILKITPDFYRKTKSYFDEGVSIIHHRTGMTVKSAITAIIMTWLRAFFEFVCEHSPSNQHEIHVPSYFSRKELFDTMVAESDVDRGSATERTFYRILQLEFPNAKFVKETWLGKCDVCIGLEDLLVKSRYDPVKHEQYTLSLQQHRKLWE